MFEITPIALENLSSYLELHKVESAVRIALMSKGCSGAELGLAFDEAGEQDEVFKAGTLEFLIEKDLLEACGEVKVDFKDTTAGKDYGFHITSTNPVGSECEGHCDSGSCSG